MQADFHNIDHWVFDLDETLYSPEICLFDEIKSLMNSFMQTTLNITPDEASTLRHHYWQTYGTTLAGLMAEHDIDPEPFMTYVHDISLDELKPDPELNNIIKSIDGTAIVYTNGSEQHARRVTAARGLDNCFDAYFGVEHANYVPKPKKAAFDTVFALANIEPKRGVIFEDDPRNLVEPHLMGMRTVLVGPAMNAPYIDHQTTDLKWFLSTLTNAPQGEQDAPHD
jgi:putative hydrolase of the HAD superfamily